MSEMAKGRRTRSKAALNKLRLIPIEDTPAEAFVAQLRAESDRGAILLMATYVEDPSTEQLRSVLLGSDSTLEDKLFGTSGILTTFAAKP